MKRRNLSRVLAMLLVAMCFVLFNLTAYAAPVGMACHIVGKPQIKSGSAWTALRTLQRLNSGDVVRCGARDEALIVLFGSGRRFRVGAGKTATAAASEMRGAVALSDASGPSTRVAQALGGARLGAVMARPATSQERLTPQFAGFAVPDEDGTVQLEWMPVENTREYSLVLFDWLDDAVGSSRIAAESHFAKIALPDLQTRRAYVWHLTARGTSGKPVENPRWGVVTFLSRADADALSTAAAPLEAQQKQQPRDATFPALLAELYRSYGVMNRTLEKLEDLNALHQPGASDALREAYRQISPYAYGRFLIAKNDNP